MVPACQTQAGISKARMTASVTKAPSRAAAVPTELREEFKFMVPDDGKEIKARVADYVKDGELTEGDEFVLMNW